jgi:predicted ATPase/class 3 adenylate cyclase
LDFSAARLHDLRVASLPAGTVTFLFTDIEGSTRLVYELGDAYADLLSEYRTVLRNAFSRHNGIEVDNQGDGFFYVFGRATDALAGARDGQAALDGQIRVRMGIHTGEPLLVEGGYVGIDVHRAARIAAVGHGGQVLLSQATRDLVEDADLRDLGSHRLKDLTSPERIYQLGSDEYRPLRSLSGSNLPVVANPLVGRETELAALSALLLDEARLVTVTGPGGSGKTRLSMQVGAELLDEFPGGVFLARLAPLASADLVGPAILQAVGVRDLADLAERHALLIVDNFEHVLDAATDVAELLELGPAVKVLVTSRVPLRLQAEHEYMLDPLPEPDAIALLVERARAARRDFKPDDATAEICRHLDGLPLALELAAARLRTLDSATLLARLDKRLPVLTTGPRDAPERQRTLRATIEWSYDLLAEDLRALFIRLGVFVGTFAYDAAEAVAGATIDTLDGLVEASLVKALPDGRFLMLETIRELALEHMNGLDDRDDLRSRHAAYFLELALTASLDTDAPTEQHPEIVVPDVANLRAALAWSLERSEIEFGLRLLVALEQLWTLGYVEEGQRWYRSFLERADPAPTRLRAAALRSFGSSVHFGGNIELAEQLWEESLAVYREIGDDHGIAVILHRLSIIALEHGDFALARDRAERSLDIHRRLRNDKGACQPIALLGSLALQSGDREHGVALLEESAELARKIRFRWWLSGTLGALAEAALVDKRVADAKPLLHESVDLALQDHDRVGLSWYLGLYALVLAEEGDTELGGRIWGAVEAANAFIPGGPWLRDSDWLRRAINELADEAFHTAHAEGGEIALEDVATESVLA